MSVDAEVATPATAASPPIHYPQSDGQPMAENTRQFRWIVFVKENLETLFADRPDVFVAGDLLWYPVEGDPTTRRAPDAMVVFGRPKGDRGSYRQWDEGGIAPQVVFEIMSPGNTFREMLTKLAFYDQYGVEEYYIYDPEPERHELTGFTRSNDTLQPVASMDGWVSPRLGVRFARADDGTLLLFAPDGTPFRSHQELAAQRTAAEQRAARAEEQAVRAEERAAALAAKLRELGIEPDATT